MKASFLSTIYLASLGAATNILVPLYFYPSPGAWDVVDSAASSYPDVTFYVIVNPNSGPGPNQYPDTTTIQAISELNSHSNIRTIGYVHTSYATRDMSVVESEVEVYAGWAEYTGSNIAMHGIFFDEAPNDNNLTKEAYMSDVASYSRSLGLNYIVFNPGALTTVAAYYDAADLIVDSEIAYSSYSESGSVDVIPTQYRSQAAVILHDTPSTVDIPSLVSTMINAGIGAFYATEDCCYLSIATPMLDAIASSLESV